MRRTVRYSAPAKLNLALSVGPPLGSEHGPVAGFHPICSWMVTVNLFDELSLTRLEDDRLSRFAILWHAEAKRRSEINWSITRDLAVKAHAALQQHVGRNLPVQMKLEKRIPVGGGLGGGSSDAAAMLHAMNDLFDLNISRDELARLGSKLGSDVPFLVHGGSAIVEGLGDRITHHDAAPNESAMHAVIVFPQASCPTAQVYRLFDESIHMAGGATLKEHAVTQLASRGLEQLKSDSLFNDLAAAAVLAAPELQTHLADLSRLAERPAHITGSGSSLFVIGDSEAHAAALADAIERQLMLPAVAVRSCAVNEVHSQS